MSHTVSKLPKKVSAFLWFFIKQRSGLFLTMFLLCAVWSIKEAFFPFFIKEIIDTLSLYEPSPEKVLPHIAFPLGLLIGIWVMMEISMVIFRTLYLKNIPLFRAKIREACFGAIARHPYDFFVRTHAGNLANKINEIPSSCERIIEILLVHGTSVYGASLLSIIILWLTAPIFGFIALVWMMLQFTIVLTSAERCNNLAAAHSNSVSSLSGKIVDSISNMMTVRLFSGWSHEQNLLNSIQGEEIEKSVQAGKEVEKLNRILSILSVAFLVTMLTLLVIRWRNHSATLGDFMLIPMLTFSLVGMMKWMKREIRMAIYEIGKIRATLQLLHTSSSEGPKDVMPLLNVPKGEILFENVTFSYENLPPLFKNLSLKIPPQQKVGLVGFSGAGKSTFVNILLRLYNIKTGMIKIDDQDLAEVQVDSIREQISVIPQDPFLFHRTLKENISYGTPQATEEEIVLAAKKAHCHEFIHSLPKGYETIVGERGVKLSTGQRQRIAIARAILKDAPILIMDEATAALDSITEQYIQANLEDLIKGKTVIIIAHRLSTLTSLDRLLVFQEGRIMEDGSFKTLLSDESSHFSKLWKMQSLGFLPA